MALRRRLWLHWFLFILCETGFVIAAGSQVMVLGTVFGCGGSGEATGASISPTTDLASVEDTTPGLRGVDANANGIRDDIDVFISQELSTTPDLQRSAEQNARVQQQLLEVTTKEEAVAAAKQNSRAEECLSRRLANMDKYIDASRKIEALTANTRERLKQYLRYNKLLSGTTHRSLRDEAIEQVCDE